MRLRIIFLSAVAFSLIFGNVGRVSAATPITGKTCPKLGAKQVYKGKTFTCIKSGKKLVWNKGVVIVAVPQPSVTPSPTPISVSNVGPTLSPTPSESPSPTPTATPSPSPTSSPTPTIVPTPKSFSDLFENRAGISSAAWSKSSEIISKSKSKAGILSIFTGPNTKPYFDDYPTAVSLVSRLFPNHKEPDKTLVIRFKYVDMSWADSTFRTQIGDTQYEQMNSTENGRLVPSQCNVSKQNCEGSMQQTSQTGISVILQGVFNTDDPNDATGKMRIYSGMLEAHEYFHALQRIPIMGKSNIWPHAWFREGGAEWVQNMAVNHQDFKTYQEYIRLDCAYDCPKLTETDIAEFLRTAKENYLPDKFPRWLNYSLGSYVIEALVAIKGPAILIDMYAEMGKQISFDQAFKNIYGIEWSDAIPILAKAIYANLRDQ